MNIEIIEQPIRFRLHGKTVDVADSTFGEVGVPLMNEVWSIVQAADIKTTGISHWVYPSGDAVFVGLELVDTPPDDSDLELLEFEHPRYAKHVHIGPYQALPEKWQALMSDLAERGESVQPYSLEIYGHHCPDETELETTILLGLGTSSSA